MSRLFVFFIAIQFLPSHGPVQQQNAQGTRGQTFSLTFQLNAGRQQSKGNLVIQVIDINDNAPRFVDTASDVSISEVSNLMIDSRFCMTAADGRSRNARRHTDNIRSRHRSRRNQHLPTRGERASLVVTLSARRPSRRSITLAAVICASVRPNWLESARQSCIYR